MDRLINLFRSLPADKQGHIKAGLAIAMVVGLAFGPFWGLAAATTAGALKEIRDYVSNLGTPELADFIATAAGGLVGYIFLLLGGALWQ